jgi:ketosteroid isomerase-like protein
MSSSPPMTLSWCLVMSARVTATGRTYHSDFTFVFRVRNGKLTAFRAYHDTDAMMRATAV